MRQHGRFAHLVDLGAVLRRARLAALEEVDKDRLPVRADQVEHQRGAVAVAGLREAIELVFGHGVPPCRGRIYGKRGGRKSHSRDAADQEME